MDNTNETEMKRKVNLKGTIKKHKSTQRKPKSKNNTKNTYESNENLNTLGGSLPKGRLQLTVRIIAKDLEISIGAAHRLLKEFEGVKIIELIKCGKETKKASIYRYNASPPNTIKNRPKHQTDNTKTYNFGTYHGTNIGTSNIDNIYN